MGSFFEKIGLLTRATLTKRNTSAITAFSEVTSGTGKVYQRTKRGALRSYRKFYCSKVKELHVIRSSFLSCSFTVLSTGIFQGSHQRH